MAKQLLMALAYAALFMLPGFALAQSPTGNTAITALSMTYAQDRGAATFEGEVLVRQDDLEIRADRMVVTFSQAQAQGTTPSAQAVKKVVATGNVLMVREQYRGRCDKATWLADQELVILEGSPELNDGRNTLSGETIRLYLAENRSEVAGSQGRPVEMLFIAPAPKKSEPSGQ